LDSETGYYYATASELNSGQIRVVHSDSNFHGAFNITYEVIVSTIFGFEARTTDLVLEFFLEAVADGPSFTVGPSSTLEDIGIDLDVLMALADIDGSETMGTDVYLKLNGGATTSEIFDIVQSNSTDAFLDGVSLIGWYRIPYTYFSTGSKFSVSPPKHFHGTFTIELAGASTELSNGDFKLTTL